MIYGYCRCSTSEERQDIDRQKRELLEMGATEKSIYWEYESGAKINRPELNKLLEIVKQGDTIVTTEVSRITRSTRQLCDIISFVQERNLKLVIKGSITIDCTNGKDIDAMSNAFLQIAGVFAELERKMISERIKSGLQNAVAKGSKLGRKPTTKESIPQLFYKYYPEYKSGKLSASAFARASKIGRTSLYKYLKIVEKK